MNGINMTFWSRLNAEIKRALSVGKQANATDVCPDIPKPELPQRHKLSDLLPHFEGIDYKTFPVFDDRGKPVQKKAVVRLVDKIIEVAKEQASDICYHNGLPYMYNGHYWEQIDLMEFQSFLSKAALAMGYDEIEGKHYKLKEDLYKQFMSEAFRTDVETDRTLINFTNGTFEITPDYQRLRPWSPDDFLKHELPFDYNPDAQAPLFEDYLNRVLPDKDCQAVLAEFLGYVFMYSLKLEKVLVLYGSGANGKSVMFDVVSAMLGEENISSYSLDELVGEDSRYRANIADKLLNYTSEINRKFNSETFKKLASNEPISARQLYKPSFIMKNYAKLMFNANELPRGAENSEAFIRRFIIIPFRCTIPEIERDPELAQKIIKTDLPGVFNWCLDGLKRLLENKRFTDSEIIRKQIMELAMENDTLLQFIEFEGFVKSQDYMLLKHFYAEYKSYCHNCDEMPETLKKVSARLEKDFGYTKKRQRGGYSFNIGKGGKND